MTTRTAGAGRYLPGVKPDKHRPVLRDEKKPPYLLLCSQRNLSQPSYRQTIDKRNKAKATSQDTAKKNPTTALTYNKRIFRLPFYLIPSATRNPD
jgi:hypothetical protein